MTTLSEIKARYLAAAKVKPIEKYCIKDHTGPLSQGVILPWFMYSTRGRRRIRR